MIVDKTIIMCYTISIKQKQRGKNMEQSKEFYYSNGNCLIQQVEDDYITAEVFPNAQANESFEKAEYETIAKIETWVNHGITGYDLQVPTDMTEQEQKEYYDTIVKFATKIRSEKIVKERNYTYGKEWLEHIAEENNYKYFEIVEDSYEYKNGLMLIAYEDEKHEVELEHTCIDLDNLDEFIPKCTQCGAYITDGVIWQNENEEEICEDCMIYNQAKAKGLTND